MEDFVIISPTSNETKTDTPQINNDSNTNIPNENEKLEQISIPQEIEDMPLEIDYINIFPKDLMDRLKNDLEYINSNLPNEAENKENKMCDSCTQTSDDELEIEIESDIESENESENITEDTTEDKNMFSSLIDYMFGEEGIITNMINHIPNMDEIKTNFKDSSFYKLFSFLFK